MSLEQTIDPPFVLDFRGEDRSTPEQRLPAGVSPDAVNIDYEDGVMRRRAGLTRLHGAALLSGGLRVSDGNSWPGGGGRVNIGHDAAYVWAGDFTYEFLATAHWDVATIPVKYVLRHSDGGFSSTPTEGVSIGLKEVGGNYRWFCRVGHTGAASLEVVYPQNAVLGAVVLVRVQYFAATRTVHFRAGSLGTTTAPLPGAETFVGHTGQFLLGDLAGAAPGMYWIVDELRL